MSKNYSGRIYHVRNNPCKTSQSSIRLLLFSRLLSEGETSLSELAALLPRSRAACTTNFYDAIRSAAQVNRWDLYNGDLRGTYFYDPALRDSLVKEFIRLFHAKALRLNDYDDEQDFLEAMDIDSYKADMILQEGFTHIETAARLLDL